MFSKFNFWIIFILLFAGLWLFEPNDADNGPENLFFSKEKVIVSKNEMKKANQKGKQSLEKKIAKTIKADRMLSPDELYDQQFDSGQAELEPTIPEIEVMPEELIIIEQEAAITSSLSEALEVDALSSDQTSEILVEDELPPSESYIEVVPFELEQMEGGFDNVYDN